MNQLRYVLESFRKAGVKMSLKKCQFGRKEVDYLGFHLGCNGISPQQSKVEANLDIEEPKNVKELRSFLGTMNFSRRFIERYAQRVEPLNRLVKKGVEWHFGDVERAAFQELKILLCNAPR